eukprot:TRINITY_DN7892_c0_g1_i4.p2 TRINITY_DN7892_c0_g1~~TRINITY_DN7892_c0_g1_i4.p2  ORF type:complete len:216 (+),score=77.15 TRINITY_DN7892_c0_g1_i4:77-724(+)
MWEPSSRNARYSSIQNQNRSDFDEESHEDRSSSQKRPGCVWCSCVVGFVFLATLLFVILTMFFLIPRPPCVTIKSFQPQSISVSGGKINLNFQLVMGVTNNNYFSVTVNSVNLNIYYNGNFSLPPSPPKEIRTLLGVVQQKYAQTISSMNSGKNEVFIVGVTAVNTDGPTVVAMTNDFLQKGYTQMQLVGTVSVSAIAQTLDLDLDETIVIAPTK